MVVSDVDNTPLTWRSNVMGTMPSIVFDLDSTLLDNSSYQDTLAEICRQVSELHPGVEPRQLQQANLTIWTSNKNRYMTELWDGTKDTFSLGEEVWELTLAQCGIQSRSIAREAARIHDATEAGHIRLYADARSAVQTLQQAGIRMALVTNGPSQLQRRKIDILGIAPWFEAVLVSAEVGHSKPEPEIYMLALESLNADPKDAWFVGDNLYTDIAGANNVGMPSVWVNRTGEPLPPDAPVPTHEVRTLAPLPGLMGLEPSA
ncbi:MAG: HAD family hydrolase [Caldilineaceae bacterium SB0665_bin_21]|nr:HAD family hydrolase [Caldilineaceae bacterium SB0665_bin_21]MYA05960.1 HAD family hydrolase [Caldilineaceae bacterium SB0664_bin_22]MYC61683.1 HAD family hydrolase [Caldilineaceae bacterium SB0661_bin_34]